MPSPTAAERQRSTRWSWSGGISRSSRRRKRRPRSRSQAHRSSHDHRAALGVRGRLQAHFPEHFVEHPQTLLHVPAPQQLLGGAPPKVTILAHVRALGGVLGRLPPLPRRAPRLPGRRRAARAGGAAPPPQRARAGERVGTGPAARSKARRRAAPAAASPKHRLASACSPAPSRWLAQNLGVRLADPCGCAFRRARARSPVVLPQVLRSQSGEDGLTDPVVIDLDPRGQCRAGTADEPVHQEVVEVRFQTYGRPRRRVRGHLEQLLHRERAGGHRDRFQEAAAGLWQAPHAPSDYSSN